MSEHTLKLHSICGTSSTPSTETPLELIARYERQTEAMRLELRTHREQQGALARTSTESPPRARRRG